MSAIKTDSDSVMQRRVNPAITAIEGTIYTNLFGTPLMVHKWANSTALNSELRDAILRFEAKAPSMPRTNVGGWHSEPGKLEFCGAAGATLIEHMYAMGNEATARVLRENGHQPQTFQWTLDAWANVNRQGNFNVMHTHPGCTWSGTYYVDTGVEEPTTAKVAPLYLLDPCVGRAASFLPTHLPSSFTVRPEPGLMVMFPSYLAHMVFPQEANGARISVAFNLRRDPFP
jgi:uncharacterized protein (TIGR02466 family)